MKNFTTMLEDLWVAITFAEAGVSETVFMNSDPRVPEQVSVPAV